MPGGTYRTSFNDESNAAEVEILGASTGVRIGNEGDRLKVSNSGDDLSVEGQGRVRVAENTVALDAYFVNTDRDSSFREFTTTGGAVTRNAGTVSMDLTTTTSSGSRAVYQSTYIHYVPGQTFSAAFTNVFGTTDTNCRKRAGLFDDNDGIYLEYDGTELTFNIRNSVTGGSDQSVTRTSFSANTFDSFDPTKDYLWAIEYLWHGIGPVSLYVYVDGSRTLLHTFPNSGTSSVPYMKTPNLPIRHEIVNVGATGSAQTFKFFCIQLSSEGREEIGVQNRTCSNESVGGKTLSTSIFRPVVSVRLKSANARAIIELQAAKMLATSNDDIIFQLVKNPTLTGASFSSVAADSVAECDIAATAVSGGIILDQGFISKSGGTPSEVAKTFEVIQSDYAGTTTDILTLQAKSLTSSATVYGILTWTELF